MTESEASGPTGAERLASPAQLTTLRLDFEPPFDAASLLRALVSHTIPGLERVDAVAGTHTRVARAPGGPVLITTTFGRDHVEVVTDATAADLDWLAARLRRWLDLDADPAAILAVLRGDPIVGPLIVERPGLRILGSLDGFESAIMTVIGQQVSLAAGRTFGARLVAAQGAPHCDGLQAFPTAAGIAAMGSKDLQRTVGLTHARARTLVTLAESVAAGLDLSPDADPGATRAALLALPGIGPWTVDCLALRVFGDRDACPANDLVLRRALEASAPAAVLAAAEPWRPYRAYGVSHLWTRNAYDRLGAAARGS